jgi:hypothetical protein
VIDARRRAARALGLAVLGLALASCASGTSGGSTSASGPLTPLVVGWEQFFTIDWKVSPAKGRPLVWGYIRNNWGMPAANMRLLVEGLDASGQIVTQQLSWVPFRLMPGTHAYFEVPMPQESPTYRVGVFAFDWVDQDDFRRRGFGL